MHPKNHQWFWSIWNSAHFWLQTIKMYRSLQQTSKARGLYLLLFGVSFVFVVQIPRQQQIVVLWDSRHSHDGLTNQSGILEHSENRRITQLKPGLLVSPHLLSKHNASIVQAHEALLHPKDCTPSLTRRCTPFRDILVALPVQQKAELKPSSTNGVRSEILVPVRKNCVVYSIGKQQQRKGDFDWENLMATICPEVHFFLCDMTSTMNLKKNMFTSHPHCIDPLSSKISLSSTMKELGHAHLDILKVAMHLSEWKSFSQQIEMILPPHFILQLYAQTKGSSGRMTKDQDRNLVNQIVLDLYDMGYRVSALEESEGMANISFLAVKEPAPQKDTILFDHAGDCPDELSIC